nr:uncharacterized protein LOC106621178 [Bactrocera oleae]
MSDMWCYVLSSIHSLLWRDFYGFLLAISPPDRLGEKFPGKPQHVLGFCLMKHTKKAKGEGEVHPTARYALSHYMVGLHTLFWKQSQTQNRRPKQLIRPIL